MTNADDQARLEAEIARAINEGDIMLADKLRDEWKRLWLLDRVTSGA